MKVLKISTAGVRGIVGQGMSAEVAIGFAQAFATYIEGGTIAVCRDSRPSGLMMRSAVLSALLASGCKVIDLGVVPTPSARLRMRGIGADGGVIIAAGHNPSPWNALKFLTGEGSYLTDLQGQELLEVYNHGEFRNVPTEQLHPLECDDQAIETHLLALKQAFDCEAIKRTRFKVAVDCCNGPCSLLTPKLLEELGCRVVVLNNRIDRPYPRYPNPTPDNMSQLESLVGAAEADIGFAHDAEGERLGIVTNRAEALHQEYTLGLCTEIVLGDSERRGPVVTNLSTSSMISQLATNYGVPCFRTPIGPAYIAQKAHQVTAAIAGEGSGNIIFPWFQSGPDGIAAILLILEHLARTGTQVSTLVERLPKFIMLKENVNLPTNQLYKRLHRFRMEAERAEMDSTIDLTDGVRVEIPDGWVHVRVSTTESTLRIITEAKTRESAQQLHQFAQDVIHE